MTPKRSKTVQKRGRSDCIGWSTTSCHRHAGSSSACRWNSSGGDYSMPWTTIKRKRSKLLLASATVALFGTGCGDILDVKNPGRVLDSDLNDPEMASTLVTGMSADFSVALGDITHMGSVLSDEMAGSSNYVWVGLYRVCLLYTSPSPRDRTRSRMPSSA